VVEQVRETETMAALAWCLFVILHIFNPYHLLALVLLTEPLFLEDFVTMLSQQELGW
jgi:hypothetical protein